MGHKFFKEFKTNELLHTFSPEIITVPLQMCFIVEMYKQKTKNVQRVGQQTIKQIK